MTTGELENAAAAPVPVAEGPWGDQRRQEMIFRDDARREVRVGLTVAGSFFVLFLGWAAVARMDDAAVARGVVTVSGNHQTLQHRDGGIISALHVREGDHVNAGDVLVEISADELIANERNLTKHLLALEAARARLHAEQAGLGRIAAPEEFRNLSPDDRKLADEALRLEQQQLNTRHAMLNAQVGVMKERMTQLAQEIEGDKRQREANADQQKLTSDELEGTKSLAARGYAPITKVRSLESALAGLRGTVGSLDAEDARANDSIGEARVQIAADEKQYAQDVVQQLRDTETQIEEVAPKQTAAREQLARAQVRAPESGRIVDLKVFTVGGVVAPGEKLMDIVPDQASLLIEANVPPDGVDRMHPGLEAQVRFPSFHERGMPVLKGVVTKVSADSFVDEKTGVRSFHAEVTVSPKELAVIQKWRGAQAGLKAGLPAEVVVPLRKRTALQYLLEPLGQAMWRSFHEQ